MLEYLYGKRFGSKIACANRKDHAIFEQRVLKRRDINFRQWGITYKRAYDKLQVPSHVSKGNEITMNSELKSTSETCLR
jgi:ribosomal protein L19E